MPIDTSASRTVQTQIENSSKNTINMKLVKQFIATHTNKCPRDSRRDLPHVNEIKL